MRPSERIRQIADDVETLEAQHFSPDGAELPTWEELCSYWKLRCEKISDAYEGLLDRVAEIRDEYRKARTDALGQMEIFAAQGDRQEAGYASAEAERKGEALQACNRILAILSSALATPEAQPSQAEGE